MDPLTCGNRARGRIRTDDLPITRRMLGVDLDGSRRIQPAHVGRLVDPDGLRRLQKDRLDDQTDDQVPSDTKSDGKASNSCGRSPTPPQAFGGGCQVLCWAARSGLEWAWPARVAGLAGRVARAPLRAPLEASTRRRRQRPRSPTLERSVAGDTVNVVPLKSSCHPSRWRRPRSWRPRQPR